eukprot:bmy_12969T0
MISPDPRPASGLARWAESYEAKCEHRQETRESRRCRPNVTTCRQEIIQLSEYLKEALQRELVLKQKMVILQDLLSALIRASDSSWKGQLNEDKLKGKLRSLENQLYTCTQRSLALAEKKCEEWKSQYEALKEDWRALGTQHRELESQLHVLQSKLQGADSRDLQRNQALRLLENAHQELQAKIERLQGDRDLCSSDTQHLQDQLKRSEEEKLALVTKVQQLQKKFHANSNEYENSKAAMGTVLMTLVVVSPSLPAQCRELHSELDSLSDEYLSCLRKLQHCREELNQSQQLPPRRQCGRWLLMLMALIAIAVAVFLANKDSLKL